MKRPTDDARTDVASVFVVFVVELFRADAVADTFANETATDPVSGEGTDVPDDADAVTAAVTAEEEEADEEDGTFVTNG